MIKILSGVPVYNGVQPEPFLSFLILSQASGKAEQRGTYELRWCTPGPRGNIVTKRNVLSQLAIHHNADYLLMMDDDMVVPSNLLDNLLRRNVDIVSPLFFRSTPPVDPLIYTLNEFKEITTYYDYPKNAIFETSANGTGVMLIKTEVLMAMGDPIWRGLADPEIAEDVEFCLRARGLGFKTWCDSTVEVRQMSLPVGVGSEIYEQTRLTR